MACGRAWASRWDLRKHGEGIALRLKRDTDLFLVAEQGGDLVGSVMGAFDGRRGWIYHLAVEARLQRHGIGRLLVGELERRLAAIGCLKVNLLIDAWNVDVEAFYERLGYARDSVIFLGKWLGTGDDGRVESQPVSSVTITQDGGVGAG